MRSLFTFGMAPFARIGLTSYTKYWNFDQTILRLYIFKKYLKVSHFQDLLFFFHFFSVVYIQYYFMQYIKQGLVLWIDEGQPVTLIPCKPCADPENIVREGPTIRTFSFIYLFLV